MLRTGARERAPTGGECSLGNGSTFWRRLRANLCQHAGSVRYVFVCCAFLRLPICPSVLIHVI